MVGGIWCAYLSWSSFLCSGLYFMERVVSNYSVTHYKLKEALKQKGGAAQVSKMADENKLKTDRVLVDKAQGRLHVWCSMLVCCAFLDFRIFGVAVTLKLKC